MTAAGLTPATPLTATQKVLQAAFLMQAYEPAFSNPGCTPNLYLQISGLNNINFKFAGKTF